MKNIEQILHSPTTSYWLRDALRSALQRDPIDAAYDAHLLAEVLMAELDRLEEGK